MSRAGEVWDDSAMESFFSSTKTERVARKVYCTREEVGQRQSTALFEVPLSTKVRVLAFAGHPSNRGGYLIGLNAIGGWAVEHGG